MPSNGTPLPLHILFIFIDGIGLGASDQEVNPFARFSLPHFGRLARDQPWTQHVDPVHTNEHVFSSIDATLDVPGLPQSGTGQATLFTGHNCAKIAGKHFGPFPHSKTKPVIAQSNIFTQVNQINVPHPEPSAFANAYPPQFFKMAEAKNRWTVTTLSCIESGIKIRTPHELKLNKALTAEITRHAWRTRLAIQVESISEQTAASHLAEISASHPFTLYEYYLTDKAGHSQSFAKAEHVLRSLDALFEGLFEALDFSNTLLLITSDHGNLEDLSMKTHTLNRVPLVAYGKGASYFSGVTSLMGVTPAIVAALTDQNIPEKVV